MPSPQCPANKSAIRDFAVPDARPWIVPYFGHDLHVQVKHRFYLTMRSIKREGRPIMIENAGAPRCERVAKSTVLLISRLKELPCVNIFVALMANRGQSGQADGADLPARRPGALRPVASDAGDICVRSFELEARLVMIKQTNCLPLLRVVATFAGQLTAGGNLVRVEMTGRAAGVGEMIGSIRRRGRVGGGFMAVGASQGHVRAREGEFRFLMAGKRERRRMKLRLRVAGFAPVRIWFGGERTLMGIGMASLARLRV